MAKTITGDKKGGNLEKRKSWGKNSRGRPEKKGRRVTITNGKFSPNPPHKKGASGEGVVKSCRENRGTPIFRTEDLVISIKARFWSASIRNRTSGEKKKTLWQNPPSTRSTSGRWSPPVDEEIRSENGFHEPAKEFESSVPGRAQPIRASTGGKEPGGAGR